MIKSVVHGIIKLIIILLMDFIKSKLKVCENGHLDIQQKDY